MLSKNNTLTSSGGKLNRSKDKDVYKYILEKNKNNSHKAEINDYFHNKKISDSRYKEYEKNISKQNYSLYYFISNHFLSNIFCTLL